MIDPASSPSDDRALEQEVAKLETFSDAKPAPFLAEKETAPTGASSGEKTSKDAMDSNGAAGSISDAPGLGAAQQSGQGTTVEELVESNPRNKRWYAYLLTRDFYLVLLLG